MGLEEGAGQDVGSLVPAVVSEARRVTGVGEEDVSFGFCPLAAPRLTEKLWSPVLWAFPVCRERRVHLPKK